MKRMKSNIFAIIALIGVTSIFSSCTERIDLELNEQDQVRLVVDGWFTDEVKNQEVRLTLTTSYFENQVAPAATGAIVSVSDDNNTWNYTEVSPGIYESEDEVAGVPGNTYNLSIEYEGEIYTASSYLREVAPIDSVAFEYIDPLEEFGFEGDPWYDVLIWTQELEGVGDAYMWLSELNGQSVNDTLAEISFVEDDFIDGVYVESVGVFSFDFETEINFGDTVRLSQWNIGPEAYEFFIAVLNETEFNGGLFDAPPANVESNISNGALGYWGAAGVSYNEGVLLE